MVSRRRLFLAAANRLAASSEATVKSVKFVVANRSYHSYPDPNELPQVSNAVSDVKKTLIKNTAEFRVDETFRLDTPFPGVPTSSGIASTQSPKTLSTKLANGLTVASQDTSGLMSSFAFLLNRGR